MEECRQFAVIFNNEYINSGQNFNQTVGDEDLIKMWAGGDQLNLPGARSGKLFDWYGLSK